MAKKAKPRSERDKPRVFSTNFPEGFKSTNIKCFVPWEDYLALRNRYVKMFKRYQNSLGD